MTEAPFDQQQAHQWFAIELNNRTWDLLESAERSEAESEEMIHAAHAACYHWSQVGGVANQARAQCLVAGVHAALGQGQPALRHGKVCLNLVHENAAELEDWDLAFAYDALARANAAAGQFDEAATLKQQARESGAAIADAEERKFFEGWFGSGEWHGVA